MKDYSSINNIGFQGLETNITETIEKIVKIAEEKLIDKSKIKKQLDIISF